MQPLINIQTIPLKYEMSITPSRIQRNSKVSQLQIEHTPGSLTIQARPARLQINSQVLPSACQYARTWLKERNVLDKVYKRAQRREP